MDQIKTGAFICKLRKENHLTQRSLADLLNISDKAVSKWERGLGCPDISILTELSEILGVGLESLLAGEQDLNDTSGGNMKKIKFYVCPVCGNIITSSESAAVSCCGRKLTSLSPKKAENEMRLDAVMSDGEHYIISDHEMTKEHYISFAAIVTGDCIMMKKLYPEWTLQIRLPFFGHGTLVWYCTKHGLFYKSI